jgi:hypothetical protein
MTHSIRTGVSLNKNRIDTLHDTHYSVSTIHIIANAPRGAAS